MARDVFNSSRLFTIISILGLITSGLFTYFGSINATWGITLMIFFTICFLAAYVAITPDFPETHRRKPKNPAVKKRKD